MSWECMIQTGWPSTPDLSLYSGRPHGFPSDIEIGQPSNAAIGSTEGMCMALLDLVLACKS